MLDLDIMAYRLDLAICSVIVDEEKQYVETRFLDGTKVGATPNFDPEALRMASELGYDNTWAMTVDHEIIHSWLAYMIGCPSFTMWGIAHPGNEDHDEVAHEEARVLAFQKMINKDARRPWDHLRKPFHWHTC